MASKAKEVAVKEKEKERDEAPPIGAAETTDTTDTLLPLLDLSDAAVKRLISIAKKRGYVTHDQVKSLSEELNSARAATRLLDETTRQMGVPTTDPLREGVSVIVDQLCGLFGNAVDNS